MDGAYWLAGFSIIISFVMTLILTKLWIRAAKKFGLTGKDMNKINGREIAEEGGIAVLFGILAGVFTYIFFKTFYLKTETNLTLMLAIVSSLLLAGFLGFIDGILGWKKGLRQWQKPLLTLPAAIPLMVIDAGHSVMSLPVLGQVNVGVLYPLIFIPTGIVGAANGFNMLAGMNGLEAGMGVIILSTLSFVALATNFPWIALLAAIAAAALLAFLLFNKYPAKVFPGDVLTYSIGALIAMLAILGDMEKVALVLFIPYFAELILKARHKFKIESFGIPQKDGTLDAPDKIGSLTHVFAKLFKTELKAVRALLATEAVIAAVILLVYL